MSRDDDTPSGEIKAAITLMRGGIANEGTSDRARCQLVGSGRREVGIAEAPKDAKVLEIGRAAVKNAIGQAILDSGGRATVEEVGGCGERLSPVGRRHRRMDK